LTETPEAGYEAGYEAGPDPARIAGAGAALLLLGVLLWLLLPLLNPVLVWAALLAVLFPFRGTKVFLPLVVTTGVFTFLWLLSELGALLAPFVVAVVLAYILNPVVNRMARGRPLAWAGARFGDTDRLPRTLAVALLAIPVAGGVAAAAIWGVPWAAAELAELARRAPAALDRLAMMLQGLEARLARLRIPGVEGAELAGRIRALRAEDIVAFLETRQQQITQWLLSGALGVGRGVGAFLTILGYLVLTPVVAFYLMRDWDRVVARAASLVPVTHAHLLTFGREYDRALAGYLRGQVMVSLIIGTMTAVGLLLAGFPYALLLGLIVAVFNVVPYLGLVLSLLPALAIALTSGDVGSALFRVALVYGIAQTLESAVISPRIVGDSTGLHPVWILLAIAVGGFFFGFVGLLLAVPAAVGIKILALRGMARYRRSHAFASDGLPPGKGHPAVVGE
jgi:predicted PurR-regulated permease PerM